MVDSDTIYILTGKFIIGVLLFIRILGFMTASPMFRDSNIPAQLKVFMGIILAISLTSIYWQEQPAIDVHLWNLVLLAFKEFFVGLALGFAANVVFWGARTAGGLIDFDLGYHTAMLFTRDEDSPTIVGELQYWATLMIFIFINGHHFLLEGLWASVRAVPIASFEVTESTVQMLIRIATSVLIIGIKMSAPVIVAIFLTNLALAMLARVAPQTNIFILSFQVKIAVGLIVLFVSVPLFVMVAKFALQSFESEFMKFLMTLNPARV